MSEIVIIISAADLLTLAPLRNREDLLAAPDGEHIWIRKVFSDDDTTFRQLPAIHTWRMDEQNRLFTAGAYTPSAVLPVLQWQTIQAFIPVFLPGSALPAINEGPHIIQLAPCTEEKEGSALLTSLDVWAAYAISAPLVRLQRLSFAVSANRQALIIGTPLPAVPGVTYSLQDNILLPAGYDLNPPAIRPLVASQFIEAGQYYLLFYPEGHYEQIPLSAFVPATRGAVRSTLETMSDV